MSKFKNWFWKNFLPISYKRHAISEDIQRDIEPTVKDLLEIKTDANEESILFWTRSVQRFIYKEWLKSINEKFSLRWNNDHQMIGDYDYTFSVTLDVSSDILRQSVEQAIECVLEEHPDIRFIRFEETKQQDGKVTKVTYQFDYKDCLDDPIKLDIFGDQEYDFLTLIDTWKKKRNS